MLLGNKVDKANRVVTKEQGEKLAKVVFVYIFFSCFIFISKMISNMKYRLWKQAQKLDKMLI